MATLSEAEIKQKLEALSGWGLKGKSIEKRYDLGSFPEAIRFVEQVAALAESEQHHPDIVINYNAVTLTLSTHSAGGVTEKDLILADQIEKLGRV